MNTEIPRQLIFWQNGMVMAFDVAGQQVQNWQGSHDEIEPKLAALTDDERATINIVRGAVWTAPE